jgi:hypothetical protein
MTPRQRATTRAYGRYACSMHERRGSGLFGVPAMIAVLVIIAIVPNVYGVGGVLIAVVARARRLPDHRRGDVARQQILTTTRD